jgi:hypothetical protein
MNEHPPIADFETLFDILDGMHKEWEVVQKEEFGGKHDSTDYNYLLRYKPTQQLYGFGCESSYNHGFDPGNEIDYPLQFWKAKITGTEVRYLYTEDKE